LPRLLHLAYRPRSWLHSIVFILIISLFLSIFINWKVVFASTFSHIFLDSLDKSGIYILPILSKKRIKGILPVGYLPEESEHIKRHKRSHVASMIAAAVLIVLIIFYK
jgi:archaellum biogenesis protein FlaJ (TadC family)